MNIRYLLFSFLTLCGALASTSASAVSEWALQKARERLAQIEAEEKAAMIYAYAERIEKEEKEKEVLTHMWMALGYCTYAAAKGTWFVAKNAVKVAAFATASTVKTAYFAVTDPDELRYRLEKRDAEPLVGIACLGGILVAAIGQLINATTH